MSDARTSKTVTRYRPYYVDPVLLLGRQATMRENSAGDYVKYDDFKVVLDSHNWLYDEKQRLEAELKRLSNAVETNGDGVRAAIAELEALRTDCSTAKWVRDQCLGLLRGQLKTSTEPGP